MFNNDTVSQSGDSETEALFAGDSNVSESQFIVEDDEAEEAAAKQDEKADNPAINIDRFGIHLSKTNRRIQRLNSDLLTAIENGNQESFYRCLDEGANENATCRGVGLTACHVAILFDRCNLLEELLNRGADDSILSCDGYLPLHLAVWKECQTCLKVLVERSPEKISTSTATLEDVQPRNLLTLDSWDHNHQRLRCNSRVPFIVAGSTALHIACRQLNADCVQCLLTKNADTEILDSRGMTPLDVVNEAITTTRVDGGLLKSSMKSRQTSVETFDQNNPKIILDPGETENEFDDISRILFLLIEQVASGATDAVTRCNLTCRKRTTLLHPTVFTQNEKLLKVLLSGPLNVSARDEFGDTPLHLAVRHRLKRSLLTLVNSEKVRNTLETRDREDKTPLLIAVSEGWNYGASVLLEVGASVTAVTCKGETVLHFATATGNESIVDELLTFPEISQIMDIQNADEETPLMVAVRHNSLLCVCKLIDVGVSLRITGKNDHTVVHVAAEMGYESILDLLLQQRDPLLREAKTIEGDTALHLAVGAGHVDCVQLLLSRGSSTKAMTLNTYFGTKCSVSLSSLVKNCDFGGGTVLHCAAARGHLAVIKCLIDHDPSLVNLPNKKGWRPMHLAAYFNNPDCVAYIIRHGGNLSHEVQYVDGRRRSTFDIIMYNLADPIAFLESMCDSYLETNEYPLNHPHVCITIKFDMLAPGGDQGKQMKVLNRLINNKNEQLQRQLLLHPLIETFLHLKWQKLRTFFIWYTLLLHAVFTSSLTAFALLQNQAAFATVCTILVFIMLVTLILLSVQEILQASKLQRYYFKDLETWIKWTTFGTAFLIGMTVRNTTGWRWKRLLPIPVLFSWIEILFLLSRFPIWGYYVLMFFRVTSAVVKVFCTFTCLFLGFVFSFYVLFEGESPFSTIGETFVKVFVMMSEFDYSDTFAKDERNPGFDIVSRFIFLLFVVLIAIVLMNLMIGLAVSDIATLEAEGRSQTLAKQIDFLSLLETFVYSDKWLSWLPQKLRKKVVANRNVSKLFDIRPGRPGDTKFRNLPAKLKRVIFSNVASRKHVGSRADILQRLLNVGEELEAIKREVIQMDLGR